MIVKMSRLRVLGPRGQLRDVLHTLQDIGLLHLVTPPQSLDLAAYKLDLRQERHRRYLRRAVQEIEYSLDEFRLSGQFAEDVPTACTVTDYARWSHLARGVSRRVAELKSSAAELEEEQALISKYRSFLAGFDTVLNNEVKWTTAAVWNVLLHTETADPATRVREGLSAAIGEKYEMRSHRLASGETALLIFAPTSCAAEVERVLAEARVQDIPVPASFGGSSLAPVAPRMLERLDNIPFELEQVAADLTELAMTYGPELVRARAAIHDRLQELEAQPLSSVTHGAFVVEGWLPNNRRPGFETKLRESYGNAVMVCEVDSAEWEHEEAPVVLSNPRIFRPFEVVLGLLPPPRYGSIDPTPFTAIFFPLFFGLMLGDVGYGLIFAALAFYMFRKARKDSSMRQLAVVAMVCAGTSTLFGFLFGEFFGDLGHTAFNMPVLLFNREDALQTLLIVAIGLGFVHIVLGLLLGAKSAMAHHKRLAIGRSATAFSVVMLPLAILAKMDKVIPSAVFMPALIGVFVGLVAMAVAEGLIAVIEFISTVGNVLSYARLMAIGVASVMLAVVANQMTNLVPIAAVGILIAVVFHLINFVLGLFAPSIHSLRLHYVEFFGKFYSPGGKPYRPFAHWGLD